MWKALRRAGEDVGRDRVARLMRAAGIHGAKRRGPGAPPRRTPTRSSDPIWCSATSPRRRPNQLWVADLTYPRCCESLVSFAFVLDACSQTLADHGVLASVGSVGDAYDTQFLIRSSVLSGPV